MSEVKNKSQIPEHLLFDVGDYVIRRVGNNIFKGVIIEVVGDRYSIIMKYLGDKILPAYESISYRVRLNNGTIINDYSFIFQLDKEILRENKLKHILDD